MSRRLGESGTPLVADAELQADVMRFVAILALCLVAISSLVEGYRSAPPETEQSRLTPPRPAVVARSDAQAIAAPATPVVEMEMPKPRPKSVDKMPAPPSSATEPTPEHLAEPSMQPEAPAQASRTEKPDPGPGLSLRFLTDAALLRLVARGEARVFVFAAGQSLSLDLSDGVAFRPGPAPARIYSMASETVPALLRANYDGPQDATWGVTLPENTRRAIEDSLSRSDRGQLVIDAHGRVSLERSDD